MVMKKSKWVAVLLCGGLVIGTIGGVYSYFTSKSDTLANNFSIVRSGGNREDAPDKGEIVEPLWDKDDEEGIHENIMPRVVVNKDPYYLSTADYPGYVYVEVVVPTANSDDIARNAIEIAGEDVEVGTELIELGETNGDSDGKTGWTLLGKQNVSGRTTYVYKYNEILEPGEKTDLPVFDTFKIKDFNVFLSNQELSIDVMGRILQGEGVDAPTSLEDYNKMYNITATALANVSYETYDLDSRPSKSKALDLDGFDEEEYEEYSDFGPGMEITDELKQDDTSNNIEDSTEGSESTDDILE